ncbi:MAG: hypothetical protein LBN05_05915 [Oscillospiraceae bacterium]|jgi:hypothetical protein|nr:hypothetical protein [Oscillospiraceae bacterium]
MENLANNAQKRTVNTNAKTGGLSLFNLLLAAILISIGQVLKVTISALLASATGGLIKPNFVIAMYCLVVLLIRPKFFEALIIGVFAGAVNQFMPAVPFINFGSEVVGALVMCLLVAIPLGRKIAAANDAAAPQKNTLSTVGDYLLKPVIGTFLATLASGFSFVGLQYLVLKEMPENYIYIFMSVIFITAALNAAIVAILYPPLKRVLKK